MIRTTVTFENNETLQRVIDMLEPGIAPKSKVVTIRQLAIEKHVKRVMHQFVSDLLAERGKGKTE